jgi:hypothetical protein
MLFAHSYYSTSEEGEKVADKCNINYKYFLLLVVVTIPQGASAYYCTIVIVAFIAPRCYCCIAFINNTKNIPEDI